MSKRSVADKDGEDDDYNDYDKQDEKQQICIYIQIIRVVFFPLRCFTYKANECIIISVMMMMMI